MTKLRIRSYLNWKFDQESIPTFLECAAFSYNAARDFSYLDSLDQNKKESLALYFQMEYKIQGELQLGEFESYVLFQEFISLGIRRAIQTRNKDIILQALQIMLRMHVGVFVEENDHRSVIDISGYKIQLKICDKKSIGEEEFETLMMNFPAEGNVCGLKLIFKDTSVNEILNLLFKEMQEDEAFDVDLVSVEAKYTQTNHYPTVTRHERPIHLHYFLPENHNLHCKLFKCIPMYSDITIQTYKLRK